MTLGGSSLAKLTCLLPLKPGTQAILMENMLTSKSFDTLLGLHIFPADDACGVINVGQFVRREIGIHGIQIADSTSRFNHIIA